jgi:endonuclease/exonuclease/phosphatase family metal-dependent hydrolase
MRLSWVWPILALVACGGSEAPVTPASLTGPPAELRAITYNMYLGLAVDIVPQSAGDARNAISAILDALSLTDFRCRIQAAARTIIDEQADVVGVQEAVLFAYITDLDDQDGRVLVDFLDELVRAIESEGGPRYQAFSRENTVTQAALPFVGGMRMVDRVGILVHPRLPAQLAGSLTYAALEPASDIVPTGTGEIVRGALHVQVPFASGALDFYTTHLQSSKSMVGSTGEVRLAQAQELSAWVDATATPGGTVVVTGDMNDVPGSPTYMALAAGLVDTYGQVGTPPGFTAYQDQSLSNPTNLASLRIDYVFVSPSSEVEESRLIFDAPVAPCSLWPSDHFGVVSRFRTSAGP